MRQHDPIAPTARRVGRLALAGVCAGPALRAARDAAPRRRPRPLRRASWRRRVAARGVGRRPPCRRPDETQCRSARAAQPGNNAPFWRGVRDSGNRPGIVNLPGAEKGVLIQRFVQYPGSRLTTAGEAWRQVRN